ncbi:hypothetical protein [Mycoplasmopsis gallinarum]|uniref:Uncharacterized protein n=1 Tax=Mycoplasmopsis gallinarum TaxID=29557 RepID=A0A168RDI1_9BACT|nr:hypothetical protein [Mycoplasmopsis gallinarum]OAB48871.1 hypothetical protein MGALLINA_04420 [Mycoplasmopsis gallinarum]
MSSINERDPEQCAIKIQKRRELLIQLHHENELELQNPALVAVEEVQENLVCQEPKCLVKQNLINPKEAKYAKISRILGVIFAIEIVVLLTILAALIGKIGS